MLRAAFRPKKLKEPKDEVASSSERGVKYGNQDFMESLKDQDIHDMEDHFMENLDDGLSTNAKTSPEDPNAATLLVKARMINPCSLDQQLDNDDNDNFPYTERQIYEMQLVQLQEQLVATMIQEQEKSENLKAYEELSIEKLQKDLTDEQEKNAELTEKVKVLKNKVQNKKIIRSNASRSDPRKKSDRSSKTIDSTEPCEDWVDLCTDINDGNSKHKPESDTFSTLFTEHNNLHQVQQSSTESTTSLAASQPVTDKPVVADCSDHLDIRKPSRIQSYKKNIIEMIVDRLWDFVDEDRETSLTDNIDDNGDSLAVKTLKENINRFTHAIKPVTHFIKSVTKIVRWSNPAFSIIAFLVYMYAARHGYVLSLILLLMVLQLCVNYLHARGFALQYGLANKENEESTSDDKSWSDKFQLVLQVARKVQNVLGKMADSLEKVKNLLMWQHPATNTLFVYLCIAFLASVVLSGPTLFMFIALGFGIKMFITGPIYARFPKVKQRYDGVARIWDELPTDADITAKNTDIVSHQSNASPGHNSTDTSVTCIQTSSMQGSQYWANLCERLKIPLSETPLPTWEEGRRCTLMNKDKPLTNMKNGKLFLTQSYLCFERNKTGSSKSFAIKLENIAHVSKCKPIGIMPGSGMAIEIEVKGLDKPYIFGALLGRDELFESLIMTGRAADLEWAN